MEIIEDLPESEIKEFRKEIYQVIDQLINKERRHGKISQAYHYQLATLYLLRGASVGISQRHLRRLRSHPRFFLLMARWNGKKRLYQKALEHYQRIAAKDLYSYEQAKIYTKIGQFEKAMWHFRNAVSKRSQLAYRYMLFFHCHKLIGALLRKNELVDETRSFIDWVLEQRRLADPQLKSKISIQLVRQKLQCLVRNFRQQPDSIISCYRTISPYSPMNCAFHLEKGRYLREQGIWQEALADFQYVHFLAGIQRQENFKRESLQEIDRCFAE